MIPVHIFGQAFDATQQVLYHGWLYYGLPNVHVAERLLSYFRHHPTNGACLWKSTAGHGVWLKLAYRVAKVCTYHGVL